MAIICAVFWLAFIFGAAYNFVEKNYIYPLCYKDEIVETAERYDIDVALLFAIVKTESGFNARAVSGKGAVGLMQILPSTGRFIADKKGVAEYDLTDIGTNLDFGGYYWAYLRGKFKGVNETAAAYNAGEGTVKKWLNNREYSADGKRLKAIPYPETAAYTEKICESMKRYEKLYGKLLDK
ncbi:MAG: lytic transglycosylase domain-containing protein [Clostridia bacterium]|nr:lytic transglycosylase domain-containing protein [Clostridia bacterium]